MKINPLTIGDEPTLDQVLLTREKRVEFQEKLAEKFHGKVLIAFKLNIPGPVKNNDFIRDILATGIKRIKEELEKHSIQVLYEKSLDEITGPEAFFITEGNVVKVKDTMIKVEEKFPTGRLYDLDVMTAKDGKFHYISREDLKLPQRTCLICGESAKVCGRSRAHTVKTMLDKIYSLVLEEKKS